MFRNQVKQAKGKQEDSLWRFSNSAKFTVVKSCWHILGDKKVKINWKNKTITSKAKFDGKIMTESVKVIDDSVKLI